MTNEITIELSKTEHGWQKGQIVKGWIEGHGVAFNWNGFRAAVSGDSFRILNAKERWAYVQKKRAVVHTVDNCECHCKGYDEALGRFKAGIMACKPFGSYIKRKDPKDKGVEVDLFRWAIPPEDKIIVSHFVRGDDWLLSDDVIQFEGSPNAYLATLNLEADTKLYHDEETKALPPIEDCKGC